MDKKEKEMYDLSLKRKWDEKVILDHAREEGRAEGERKGIEQEKSKVITKLINQDFDDATIVSLTEYDIELVQAIRIELGLKKKLKE